MCKVGEVVVVGGVRRSALISLSNLNDDQMAHAKAGEWWNKTVKDRWQTTLWLTKASLLWKLT